MPPRSRDDRPAGNRQGGRRVPQPRPGGNSMPPPSEDVNSEVDDEEEPEGDDLFGDNFQRDYDQPDSSLDSAGEDDLDSFIQSDGGESEISDAGRLRVGRMLDQRHRVERVIAERRRRQEEAGDGGGSELSFGGGGAASDPFEEEDEEEEGIDEDVNGGGDRSIDGLRHPPTSVSDAATGHQRGGPMAHDAFFEGDVPGADTFDWTRPHGELADWLAQDAPRRVVKNRIYNFLLNFHVNGTAVYVDRVGAMTRANGSSFEVSYLHVGEVYGSVLALWLVDCPDLVLELFDEAANFLVYQTLYPNYGHVHRAVRVRIADIPLIDPIRDFRQTHRDVLVRVEGVVIRRSPVYPQLQAVRYDCGRCSYVIGPVMQRSDREVKVSQCPSCQSKGPFRVNVALTEYRSHQTLVLQESPGTVPPGRLPRSMEAILTHDLIDRARPGDHVEVIGTYRNTFDAVLNSRQGFPVFSTVLFANNVVARTTDGSAAQLPEADRLKILSLSRDPRIKRKLVASIAPSIHGRDDIKLGLLLALLGGVSKDILTDRSHRIRGDLNVLIVGDPGTAKSQCLKFVEKVADRAVFTTGRGSTAVGLTASVQRDAVTGDFTLEGGALVIADRGVCLIDEFDKMSDQDRTSIHEAMEQQTISVARGGIVTTLSARCSIVAAANPIGGRYDPSVSFDANVDLTTPILSRFDMLFVVRDEVHTDEDTRLAQFICKSHQRSHPRSVQEAKEDAMNRHRRLVALGERRRDPNLSPEELADVEAQIADVQQEEEEAAPNSMKVDDDPASPHPLPQSLLKKYLAYARSHCRPLATNIDSDAIATAYAEVRQECKRGGIPITVRNLESIIRLAEAHAKIFLRDFVAKEDVNAAIALFLRCFLNSQKYRLRKELEVKFRRYLDADVEPLHLLHHRLRHMVHQMRLLERRLTNIDPVTVTIEVTEFAANAASLDIATDAITAYYTSAEFQREFELVHDNHGIPVHVRHTRQLD